MKPEAAAVGLEAVGNGSGLSLYLLEACLLCCNVGEARLEWPWEIPILSEVGSQKRRAAVRRLVNVTVTESI